MRGGIKAGAGRPAYRVKAEQSLRLDVRQLARRNLLHCGWFTWQWSYGGEPHASIGVHVNGSDSLRLDYSVHGHQTEQTVLLRRTKCHYGGARPWFSCPVCARRVACLFMRSGRFACRHCQHVAYASQSRDRLARLVQRRYALESQVEDGKPKGMRWATFHRVCDQIEEIDVAVNLQFINDFSRFGFGSIDDFCDSMGTK